MKLYALLLTKPKELVTFYSTVVGEGMTLGMETCYGLGNEQIYIEQTKEAVEYFVNSVIKYVPSHYQSIEYEKALLQAIKSGEYEIVEFSSN